MTDDEIDVEVNISRYSGGELPDEITIVVTIPKTATEPKKRIYVTLTPHDFALALTGRGGIKGKMCQCAFEPPKAKK
jgi:hypothetical protein